MRGGCRAALRIRFNGAFLCIYEENLAMYVQHRARVANCLIAFKLSSCIKNYIMGGGDVRRGKVAYILIFLDSAKVGPTLGGGSVISWGRVL